MKSKIFSYPLIIMGMILMITCSCKKEEDTPTPTTTTTTTPVATVVTSQVSDISQTTAVCGGAITSDGGATVTAKGVCWSTSQNPTIANSKTADGTGAGNFISNITGLSLNTTYYVRAYATSSAGTGYGSAMSFTTAPAINAANLVGTYSVSETSNASGSYTYQVTVTSPSANCIAISNFGNYGTINATLNETILTIPSQTITIGSSFSINIVGSGLTNSNSILSISWVGTIDGTQNQCYAYYTKI